MALSVGRTEAAERFLPRAFAQRPDLLGAEPDHRWAAIAFVQVSGVAGRPGDEDVARIDAPHRARRGGRRRHRRDAARRRPRRRRLPLLPHGRARRRRSRIPKGASSPRRCASSTADDRTTSLRAGVTSGRVFAGFVGAMYRQTYTVMGDPTNLAARLTARAEPGTVLRRARRPRAHRRPFDDRGRAARSPSRARPQQIPVAVVTGARRRPDARGAADARSSAADDELERLVGAARMPRPTARRRRSRSSAAGGHRQVASARPTPSTRRRCRSCASRRPVRRRRRRTARSSRCCARSSASPPDGDAGRGRRARSRAAVASAAPGRSLPWLPLLAPAVGADGRLDARSRRARRRVPPRAHARPCSASSSTTCSAEPDVPRRSTTRSGSIPHPPRRSPRSFARRHRATPSSSCAATSPEASSCRGRAASSSTGSPTTRPPTSSRRSPGGRCCPPTSRRSSRAPRATRCTSSSSRRASRPASDALGIEQLVGERIDALTEQERAIVRRASVLGLGHPARRSSCAASGPPSSPSGRVSGFLDARGRRIRFRSELFRDVAYDQLNFQTRRELHRAVAAALEADPALGGHRRRRRCSRCTTRRPATGMRRVEAAAAQPPRPPRAPSRSRRRCAPTASRSPPRGASRPAPPELPALLESLGRVRVAERLGDRGARGLRAGARKLIDRRRSTARASIASRAYALNVARPPRRGGARPAQRAPRGAARRRRPARGVLAAVAVTEAGLRLRQARWADARAARQRGHRAARRHGDRRRDDTRVLADAYATTTSRRASSRATPRWSTCSARSSSTTRSGDELSQVEGAEPARRRAPTTAATGRRRPASTRRPQVAAEARRRRRRRRDRVGERRRDPHRPGPHRRGAPARCGRRCASSRHPTIPTSSRSSRASRAARTCAAAIRETARGEFDQAADDVRGARRDGLGPRRARAPHRGATRPRRPRPRRAAVIAELLAGDACTEPVAQPAAAARGAARHVWRRRGSAPSSTLRRPWPHPKGRRFERALSLARLADADVRPDLLAEARADPRRTRGRRHRQPALRPPHRRDPLRRRIGGSRPPD